MKNKEENKRTKQSKTKKTSEQENKFFRDDLYWPDTDTRAHAKIRFSKHTQTERAAEHPAERPANKQKTRN